MASNSGFKVIAAATFIGEHSFSTPQVPLAEKRPNKDDLKKAEEFGKNIIKKIPKIDNLDKESFYIPKSKLPLTAKMAPKNSARLVTRKPVINKSLCTHCNICANWCPVGAIDKDTLEIKEELCLRCFSCVKRCVKKARKIVYRPKFIVSKVLKRKNKIFKEPKIYL